MATHMHKQNSTIIEREADEEGSRNNSTQKNFKSTFLHHKSYRISANGFNALMET